jgi:hypothetical protein
LSIENELVDGCVHAIYTYIVDNDNVGAFGVSGAYPAITDIEVEYAPSPYLLIALM